MGVQNSSISEQVEGRSIDPATSFEADDQLGVILHPREQTPQSAGFETSDQSDQRLAGEDPPPAIADDVRRSRHIRA